MRPLPPITRRRFLGGSLALGAGLVAGCSSSTPRADEQRRKVIVIGTGFGGSVTALRLGEAGVDVTLIERGQRWASGQPDTFPTFAAPDHRVSWLSETNTAAGNLFPSEPWTPYTGLMERIAGDGMDVVCGAAVGGGSLPYHGMTVQPRGDLFDQVMPDELDYQEFDERWYPLVREALSATPIPDDVLASDAYASSRTFIEAVRGNSLCQCTRPLTRLKSASRAFACCTATRVASRSPSFVRTTATSASTSRCSSLRWRLSDFPYGSR